MSLHRSSFAVVAAGTMLLGPACATPVDTGVATSSLACDRSPAVDTPYTTVAELSALLVGLWARCDGRPQLEGEELGVEFTAGHDVYPLQRGPHDTTVRVPPVLGVGPESWTVLPDTQGKPRLVFMWASSPTKDRSSFLVDGTSFADDGLQMFLPYAPAGATYVRLLAPGADPPQ